MTAPRPPAPAGPTVVARPVTGSESANDGVERAEQAQRRLASIIESSVDAVIGVDRDGIVTDWNPAAERVFGYPESEACGRPFAMLVPPGHEAEYRDLTGRALGGERIENVDLVRRRKDGALIELTTSISPVYDGAGEIVGTARIGRDVTERRHDERTIAALHAVAYSAGHIMDTSRLVAVATAQVRDAFGVDLLIVYWWDEANQMLRAIGDPGELAGTRLPDDSARRSGEGLAGVVFETRSPLIVDDYASWPQAHPSFKDKLGSAMAVPMYVGEQEVGVLAAVAIARRSFTDHDLALLTRFAAEVAPAIAVGQLIVDAQARRAEAEALVVRVSVYFRANPVPAVIIRRSDDEFVDANDAFVELVGFPRDELVGRAAQDVGVFADPPELAELLAARGAAGQEQTEITLRTRAGELRSALAYVELTEIAGDACLIVGCVDLTEHRRAEALDRQQQVIETANRAKSAFLANMSHELRTPLNAILGFSELLLEQLDLNDRHKKFLNNVNQAGRHLLELINDVLDISRVEAGKMELRRESIPLPTLLEPIVTAARLAAEGRQIRFETGVIPAVTVSVDPTRVRQIVDNLLSNAVKFTPPRGSVRLTAIAGPDALVFEVRDTGIGIPAESRDRVFGTFERFHEGVDAEPGTGLGLALTKALVELHGGTIAFETATGLGTTFTVRLPGTVPHVVAGAQLLVVEDDRSDADLLVALIERRGLTADVVTSVADALAAIERRLPAGIVLDLSLPDGRGEIVLRALRKRETRVPAVVVTALDEEADAGIGVDDYLTKPIEAARFYRWLDRIAIQEEVPSADLAG